MKYRENNPTIGDVIDIPVYVGAINLPKTKQTNNESKRQKLSEL